MPLAEMLMLTNNRVISCCAFKLGMGSDQDGRTTKISQLLIIGFK